MNASFETDQIKSNVALPYRDRKMLIQILPCVFLCCICEGTDSPVSFQDLLFQGLDLVLSCLFSLLMFSYERGRRK